MFPVLEVIVQALRYEHRVRYAEVDGQCDDGGDEASPDGADEVGDVADHPYTEEGNGDGFGGAGAVVLDELGDLREKKER